MVSVASVSVLGGIGVGGGGIGVGVGVNDDDDDDDDDDDEDSFISADAYRKCRPISTSTRRKGIAG